MPQVRLRTSILGPECAFTVKETSRALSGNTSSAGVQVARTGCRISNAWDFLVRFRGYLLRNLTSISACNSDVTEYLANRMKAEYECQICFKKGEENAALVSLFFRCEASQVSTHTQKYSVTRHSPY